jgi:hypothetical protein
MMHKSRTWCIFPIATKEDLAHKLADSTWCLCTAFEIGDYLFLNDATSEDAAAEYAVLKKPATAEAPYMQIESITASWMSEERLLEFISRTLAGEYDESDWVRPVEPKLETCAQHQRCHRCA